MYRVIENGRLLKILKLGASSETKLGCRWRDCFSDEHYFATLLAVLGRENETDCRGFMMHVDWSRGGAHPRTYELREISAAR